MMKFYYKSNLFLIIAFFWGGVLFAQQETNKGDFLFREKIYLHTDKNTYVAGEVIWFKIFNTDGYTNIPLTLSKVCYVEILNSENIPVLQAKVDINSNNLSMGGNGSFYIPLSLKSDNYTIRAYTAWMKNLGNSSFFEKTIAIINTMKAGMPEVENSNNAQQIDFFPEGGRLLEGVDTKVGFKITNNIGAGISGNGWVIDNTGDTAAKFTSFHKGMGSFHFKPLNGKTYKAIVYSHSNRILEKELPIVAKQGYLLNIQGDNNATVNVRIVARTGKSSERMFLVVHFSNNTKFTATPILNQGEERIISIDKSRLGPGVNNITLFNEAGNPVCERLVFNRVINNMDATLQLNKHKFHNREEATLTMSGNSLAKQGGDSVNYSFAVYKIDNPADSNGINILNYLLLSSEIKNTIEDPGFYFSNEFDKKTIDQATDDLLLTHGWRRFNWTKSDLSAKQILPELKSHTITGRVVNTLTGDYVAGADCYLTVPSIPYKLYASKSDTSGMVFFEIMDYYGPGDIIPQVWVDGKTNYRIDIMNPFAQEAVASAPLPMVINENKADDLLSRSIGMQAQNIYWGDSLRNFRLPSLSDTMPFFGKSEFSYLLDDYKRFTTMEEVLREYIAPVTLTMQDRRMQLRVVNELSREVYRNNAFVMLDGVPLVNYNKIIDYDPLKIKRLRAVPRKYIIGSRTYFGVLSFESYEGRFDGFELDSSLIAIDYEGLQLQREFYSPTYTDKNLDSRMPDMRTTLLWNPDVMFSKQKELRFFTSDTKGKFVAVLEGVTKQGEPIVAKTFFEVE